MGTGNAEVEDYVEAVSLPDIWFDGIQRIEPASGGCFRFILYRLRRDDTGRAFREPVANLVCSGEIVTECCYQAMAEVARATKSAIVSKMLAS